MAKSGKKLKPISSEGFPYNGETAHWWLWRSMDRAHRRAYRNIADFVRASYLRDPRIIVDYACGAGNLLSLLSRRFPNSTLVGLDGSAILLETAQRRFKRLPAGCARRMSLAEAALPGSVLKSECADLLLFCFPNMTPYSAEDDAREAESCRETNDWKIAESLEPGAAHVLEWNRSISHDLRGMLIRGGICIRIEYATMRRQELSPSELTRVAFEEGSLDMEVDGRIPNRWFRFTASAYFRSGVLEDVYLQTGNERDRNGGYLITVLKAI